MGPGVSCAQHEGDLYGCWRPGGFQQPNLARPSSSSEKGGFLFLDEIRTTQIQMKIQDFVCQVKKIGLRCSHQTIQNFLYRKPTPFWDTILR